MISRIKGSITRTGTYAYRKYPAYMDVVPKHLRRLRAKEFHLRHTRNVLVRHLVLAPGIYLLQLQVHALKPRRVVDI